MYGACVNPPWGFGFGIWAGQAFNRTGATVAVGTPGHLDLGQTQAETTNGNTGEAASSLANVRALLANQIATGCVVVALEVMADNGYGRWALAKNPLSIRVGSSNTVTLATASAGAPVFQVPAKTYLDIVEPTAEPGGMVGEAHKIVATLQEDTPTYTTNDTPTLVACLFDGWNGRGTLVRVAA